MHRVTHKTISLPYIYMQFCVLRFWESVSFWGGAPDPLAESTSIHVYTIGRTNFSLSAPGQYFSEHQYGELIRRWMLLSHAMKEFIDC